MQEIAEIAKSTDLDSIKYLLRIVIALCGFQFAALIWLAKKKFKQIDEDHEILIQLKTEHGTFHKSETGLNNGK